MKVFNTIALVSGLVAADNKKVPPRRPDQRLGTLSTMYQDYVDSHIKESRPGRAEFQKGRIQRMADAMLETYNEFKPDGSGLRRCSFFDPTLPNGGPRPSNDGDRKRRDVDAEDPFDVYEQNLQDGERSASVRLSSDSALALRQVFSKLVKF